MKPWLFGAGRRLKPLPGERYLSPYLIDTGERQGKKERDQPRNYRNQQDVEGQTTPENGGRDSANPDQLLLIHMCKLGVEFHCPRLSTPSVEKGKDISQWQPGPPKMQQMIFHWCPLQREGARTRLTTTDSVLCAWRSYSQKTI